MGVDPRPPAVKNLLISRPLLHRRSARTSSRSTSPGVRPRRSSYLTLLARGAARRSAPSGGRLRSWDDVEVHGRSPSVELWDEELLEQDPVNNHGTTRKMLNETGTISTAPAGVQTEHGMKTTSDDEPPAAPVIVRPPPSPEQRQPTDGEGEGADFHHDDDDDDDDDDDEHEREVNPYPIVRDRGTSILTLRSLDDPGATTSSLLQLPRLHLPVRIIVELCTGEFAGAYPSKDPLFVRVESDTGESFEDELLFGRASVFGTQKFVKTESKNRRRNLGGRFLKEVKIDHRKAHDELCLQSIVVQEKGQKVGNSRVLELLKNQQTWFDSEWTSWHRYFEDPTAFSFDTSPVIEEDEPEADEDLDGIYLHRGDRKSNATSADSKGLFSGANATTRGFRIRHHDPATTHHPPLVNNHTTGWGHSYSPLSSSTTEGGDLHDERTIRNMINSGSMQMSSSEVDRSLSGQEHSQHEDYSTSSNKTKAGHNDDEDQQYLDNYQEKNDPSHVTLSFTELILLGFTVVFILLCSLGIVYAVLYFGFGYSLSFGKRISISTNEEPDIRDDFRTSGGSSCDEDERGRGRARGSAETNAETTSGNYDRGTSSGGSRTSTPTSGRNNVNIGSRKTSNRNKRATTAGPGGGTRTPPKINHPIPTFDNIGGKNINAKTEKKLRLDYWASKFNYNPENFPDSNQVAQGFQGQSYDLQSSFLQQPGGVGAPHPAPGPDLFWAKEGDRNKK
ncbi:unnamed protein product [Amoebophrya sp. A120]|nr:unnamed protein product [Amoebophrya sp. A120]|eukprot:GSA120T00014539001.1